MPYFAGLSLEEIQELGESLETRIQLGVCDDHVCTDAIRLARATHELIDAYDRVARRNRVVEGQLAEIRRGKTSRKKGDR